MFFCFFGKILLIHKMWISDFCFSGTRKKLVKRTVYFLAVWIFIDKWWKIGGKENICRTPPNLCHFRPFGRETTHWKDLGSPWLLATYKSWDDPPSSPWQGTKILAVGDFLPIEVTWSGHESISPPSGYVWVNDFLKRKSQRLARWRFQILFIFTSTPLPREMIQFDEHIFQMGWFSHHLVGVSIDLDSFFGG